jgi:hypothetical protein
MDHHYKWVNKAIRRYLMAAIGNIDWSAVKQNVEIRNARRTGMVSVISQAAREIMADGNEYDIAHIRGWIEAGINQDLSEDEKIQVNWITVKYTLTHTAGFREVSKNTFVYNPTTTKKGRK